MVGGGGVWHEAARRTQEGAAIVVELGELGYFYSREDERKKG